MDKIIKPISEKIRKDDKNELLYFFARYFKWIYLLTAILIFAGGYFFFIGPKRDEVIVNREVDLEKKKLEYESNLAYLERLEKINENYHSISAEDLAKINKMIPDKGDPEDLIAEVESLILKSGLLPTSIQIAEKTETAKRSQPNIAAVEDEETAVSSVSEKKSASNNSLPSGAGRITVSAEISGVTYGNLKAFLASVENNLRLIDIRKIDFSSDGEKLSAEMDVYYYKKNQ